MPRRNALACAIALALALPAVSPAEDAADADAQAFLASCASCHGAQGTGDTPAGRAMKVPSFPGSELAGSEATAICERAREVSQHAALLKKVDAATLAAACRRVKELAAAAE